MRAVQLMLDAYHEVELARAETQNLRNLSTSMLLPQTLSLLSMEVL